LAAIGLDFFIFAGVFNKGPAFAALRRGKRVKDERGKEFRDTRASRPRSLRGPFLLGQGMACHGDDYNTLWF